MSQEAVICLGTAQEAIRQFAKAWGLQDSKAIITAGKETSIPVEATELLLASIMVGSLEVVDGGKKVIQHLSAPINDRSTLEYKHTVLRRHNFVDIQGRPENDQMVALVQLCTGITDYEVSELGSRDLSLAMAVAIYVSFT